MSPENVPRTTLHSTEIPTAENGWSGQNYPWLPQPRDGPRRWTAAERELDPDKRRAFFADMLRLYADDLPVLPMYFRVDLFVIPKQLKGIVPTGHQGSTSLWIENLALAGLTSTMGRYLASRAAEIVITLVIMSFVVYLLIGLMPGDPIDMLVSGNPKMTSEDAKRLRALYGVDKPLIERYLAWAHQALTRQLRLLALAQPAGAGGAVAAPTQHARARGARLPDLDGDRAAARRLGRGAAAQQGRLPGQSVLLRRHLDADLLARAAADLAVRGQARLAAGGRHGRPARRHAVPRRDRPEHPLRRSCRSPRSPSSSSASTPASCAAR